MACLTLAVAVLPLASTAASPDAAEISRTPAAPSIGALPAIAITVESEDGISPATLKRMFAETDAIWKPAGLSFVWQRRASEPPPDPSAVESAEHRRELPSTLRVIIDHERGQKQERDLFTPLGWIVFEGPDAPVSDIHVSYGNARALLAEFELVVHHGSRMTVLERETYLARAMGRVLAHELGHYLLASKVHTLRGLMQTRRSAAELFSAQRSRFDVDRAQRDAIAARLARAMTLSRR